MLGLGLKAKMFGLGFGLEADGLGLELQTQVLLCDSSTVVCKFSTEDNKPLYNGS